MMKHKIGFLIRALLLVMSFGFISWGQDADARAGSKRSFGQRSQPSSQPRSNPPPSQQQPNSQPQPQVQPNRGGGFMRGLAGGVAGGLLGSMLFSSFGHASGLGGGGGMGGVGLFDIVLIAGLAYVGWRFWKSRQNRPAFAGAGGPMASSAYSTPASSSQDTGYFAQGVPASNFSSVSNGPRLDRNTAEDIFFRVQGAWTRQDLKLVQDVVEQDIARVLESDLQELKAKNAINRLENISVRGIDIGDSWFEGDRECVRVRFTASLLDYTVDASSGAVKEGSSSEPVKFDENWIFAKSQGRSSWQLAGIEQI